ncbi:MAG: DUF3164 family protein [Methylobacter sp.]|nr:DUF3164 family protein [Methylobacter sp.]
MNAIDLKQLSPEQKADLMEQLKNENIAKKNSEKAERESYKTIVNSTVKEQFVKLEKISSMLSIAKADIYRQFAAIIELKQELYGAKSGQMSHTFTDDEGQGITIGWRQVDAFNDTLDMGIALISEYIGTLAVDDNSANLVEMINRLLKKDAKGNLKPNRILDLRNLAEKIGNEQLSKGVEIVLLAYQPSRSVIFVEAETKNQQGAKQAVALSITSAPFPQGYEPNFNVFVK